MDAPPISRLVDLVHAFNGVVVEQFEKRVEKLLSNSSSLIVKATFQIVKATFPNSTLVKFENLRSVISRCNQDRPFPISLL